jgi:proteasome lid subunit RPN8/RPN11
MEQYDKLIKELGQHSTAEHPNECVGIITKDFQYIRCRNISDSPRNTFILDPRELVKHDGNIWGIFHSHPGSDNPIPSIEDKHSAAFTQYKFLVGFSSKIFIYWLDKKANALKFEPFEEHHIAGHY